MTFDEIIKLFADSVKSTEIRWRDTMYCNMQYYYAEERLYLLRISNQGHYEYTFVYANDPQEAAQNAHFARNRPVIKTENGWHIDDRGNRWDAKKYTAEYAESASRTLWSCRDCINCVDCIGCRGCVGCSYCWFCFSCIRCLHCTECMFCIQGSHSYRLYDKSNFWDRNIYGELPEGFRNLVTQPKQLADLLIHECNDGRWWSPLVDYQKTKAEAVNATAKVLREISRKRKWW